MKVCGRCEKDCEDDDFYRNRANEDGLSGWCKKCTKGRRIELGTVKPVGWKRKTENIVAYLADYRKGNVEKLRKAHRAWMIAHPNRKKCKDAYRYALNVGKLKRGVCDVCGAVEVDGHHTDYEKPLEVVWLCREHHLEAHALLRKG